MVGWGLVNLLITGIIFAGVYVLRCKDGRKNSPNKSLANIK